MEENPALEIRFIQNYHSLEIWNLLSSPQITRSHMEIET